MKIELEYNPGDVVTYFTPGYLGILVGWVMKIEVRESYNPFTSQWEMVPVYVLSGNRPQKDISVLGNSDVFNEHHISNWCNGYIFDKVGTIRHNSLMKEQGNVNTKKKSEKNRLALVKDVKWLSSSAKNFIFEYYESTLFVDSDHLFICEVIEGHVDRLMPYIEHDVELSGEIKKFFEKYAHQNDIYS